MDDGLGIAYIAVSNTSRYNIIKNSDIQLLTQHSGSPLTSADMQNIALHEIGHALGLAHKSGSDIMNPYLTTGQITPLKLSAGNVNTLKKLYEGSAKPDLAIPAAGTAISMNRTSLMILDKYTLNVDLKIHNYGIVDVHDVEIEVRADGKTVNTDVLDEIPLGGGLHMLVQGMPVDCITETTNIQVIVDPYNKIEEIDENNNQITAMIDWIDRVSS